MNDAEFEALAAKIRKIDGVLKELDASIRAEAFELLKPFVVAGSSTSTRSTRQEGGKAGDSGSGGPNEGQSGNRLLVTSDEAREFLAEHEGEKEADNAKAIAALIYSKYGAAQFTAAEVNAIADEAGVTVPARVDVTLNGASVNKKSLFQKVRSGVFRPTIHGERFLKESYAVSKGTQTRPEMAS